MKNQLENKHCRIINNILNVIITEIILKLSKPSIFELKKNLPSSGTGFIIFLLDDS